MAEEHLLLEQWEQKISAFIFPRWNELPEIELYMDQVVSYLSQKLAVLYDCDVSEENKSITATMINNYVKQKIVAAPVKKRYDRARVSTLLMLFCVKQVLSIGECAAFLTQIAQEMEPGTAYDRFCTVFEEILHRTVHRTADAADITAYPAETAMLSTAAIAFAHKIYAEKMIACAVHACAAGRPAADEQNPT